MNKLSKIITATILVLMSFINTSWAQDFKLDPMYFHIFDKDSLKGFEEDAARASAISEQYLGAEFKVKMYQLKRAFINNRYNLWPKPIKNSPYSFNTAAKLSVVPGCTNEDFEASTAGSVTAQNQITGWTVTRGNVNPPNNACNLNGCCTNNPVESELISAPNGIIDPVIGSIYPIFSVFGSTAANPNAALNNPQIAQSMFGDKFIRINSSGLGAQQAYSVERLSKTFAVTSNNALFQFAFIFVSSTGHSCCSAGAFQIKLTNATTNSVIACPSYSAAGPSGSCQNYTVNGINFLNAVSGTPATVNSGIVFNKWQVNSMDLTPYIGQNITIDIIANDCDASGHYGYVYFDAQCGPMVVYGNGTPYGAGSGNITVPTCGAAGATLCASSGLGPYSWAGPGVSPAFAAPSQSNICYITNISGTYTLFMNPQGSCSAIQRIISATITPAPLLAASIVQAVCGSTTAVVTITPSGSAAVPSTLIWSPPPLSINPGTTIATYSIPPGPAPTVVNISATDPLGCLVIATVSVNPAAPVPTFTFQNVTGTTSLTCNNTSVEINALSTYTYGMIDYIWVSAGASYSGTPVTITTPGNYTVTGFDPVSGCGVTKTISIGSNFSPPTSNISPLLQNITCTNSVVVTVTATALSPSINVQHDFMSPLGGTVTVMSQTAIFSPGPGTYTHVLINLLNGCKVTKTFTITAAPELPTFSVNSPSNFTLGCGTKSMITVNISNAATSPVPGGAVSYTFLPPGSSTLFTTNSAPTITNVTVPGTWTVVVQDNATNCRTRVPISIVQNTFTPNVEAIVPNQTLTCATPTVKLEGASLTPNVSYNWSFPTAPGNLQGIPITIITTSNTTNTLVANYTLTVIDNNNTCKSSSIIPMYQNIFPPKVGISLSSTVIACNTSSVVLTNTSSSQSPSNFPNTQIIQGYLWEGPPPQFSESLTSNYNAFIPGVYTLTAKNLNNGCLGSGTVSIADNRIFPVVNNPVGPDPFFLDCGTPTVAINAIISNANSNFTFLWHTEGSGTSSTSAITNSILNVNSAGIYEIEVLNPSNGCKTTGTVSVKNGSLTSNFTPDKISGFAPLTVNFTNNSTSSSTISSTIPINSVWNFGNGTSSITPASSITPSSIYTQPGTYTVTIFNNKGSCQDVYKKIIVVDIPSKLEVPNVFTPNGDGSNDIFFLKASNLTEITALIYDRWGNKIYELTSNTGNIAWDGKNQVGKDVAEGTYFYIITAKGKDGLDYNTKGNLSLYR